MGMAGLPVMPFVFLGVLACSSCLSQIKIDFCEKKAVLVFDLVKK